MSRLLAEHDRLVVAAADRGVRRQVRRRRSRSSTEAEGADRRGPGAARQPERHGRRPVLDEWLTRNEDYDVALRNLYKALSKVGTKVTKATRAARRRRRPRRAPSCRPTPAAWS